MARRPDVWLRRKEGRADSWYFRKLRLRTKDAVEARHRARLSGEGKWPPHEEKAAAVSAAAFSFDLPAPAPAPAPASSPAPETATPPPPISGDWTHAATAAAAGAESAAPGDAPEPSPSVSSEALAEMLVSLELKAAEIYVQQKVYEPFVAPAIAAEGRAMLVGAYRSIIEYGGAAMALPPWVNGLVVPALTVVVSSMAIVAGFRDQALAQKQTAEGGA